MATAGVKALGIDSTQFIDSPTQPRCVAFHNTTQSVSDSTATALSLNSEDIDTTTMHDTVTNNSRVTVPTGGDGFYLVIGFTSFAANATPYREIAIRKNGTTLLVDRLAIPSAAVAQGETVMWMGNLVATDYVELYIVQTSGGALNVGSATRANSSTLSVVKLW